MRINRRLSIKTALAAAIPLILFSRYLHDSKAIAPVRTMGRSSLPEPRRSVPAVAQNGERRMATDILQLTDVRNANVRLMVVDKDPILRAGIRSIMRPYSEIEVVGDFDSMRHAAARAPWVRPNVLLVGPRHLDDQFDDTLQHLVSFRPDRVRAVLTVVHAHDQVALSSAIMRSVRGFVDRNTCHEDLGQAVLDVHDGRTYLSSSIAETLVGWVATWIDREQIPLTEIDRTLTQRELEILAALGDGITNTAIARRLHIQEATVRSHVYHILSKLNLRTRTEAVLAGYSYSNTRRNAGIARSYEPSGCESRVRIGT
jgi:DNA-binding NarL/FixJ family response regulator